MSSSVVIRPAHLKDMPAVHALIAELAAYEKAAHEHTCSLEQLSHDFANGYFGCLLAESSPALDVLGILIYCFPYSTWKGRVFYIEDIVVKASHRGNGIGKRLFDEALRLAQAAGVGRVAWQVLEWNEPAIRFYRKLPVSFDAEWLNCRMTPEQLQLYWQQQHPEI